MHAKPAAHVQQLQPSKQTPHRRKKQPHGDLVPGTSHDNGSPSLPQITTEISSYSKTEESKAGAGLHFCLPYTTTQARLLRTVTKLISTAGSSTRSESHHCRHLLSTFQRKGKRCTPQTVFNKVQAKSENRRERKMPSAAQSSG